jgi:hypothetical protein
MTRKEFADLTREYETVFFEYEAYMNEFFTSHINGVLEHRATKTFTSEEVEKTDAMKKKLDEVEKRWYAVASDPTPLTE